VFFLREPENTAVELHQTAKFYCTYSGSITSLRWVINGAEYTLVRVPWLYEVRREVGGFSLFITEVTASLNMSEYQCIVYVTSTSAITSKVGILQIGES